MHQIIQDGLEDYLAGAASSSAGARIDAHLRECKECREEVALMRETSDLFASLRSPEPPAPAPGFYARVSNLIEKQQPQSVWTIFLEPIFGRRLALASLLLLAMLGTVLVSRETEEYAVGPSPEMILAVETDAPMVESGPAMDRDQMLFTLASHHQ